MNNGDVDMAAKRKPGDPIPGALIKELRDRHGLTQAALAERLGIKGGKTVISGWEHSACEGPAAELILILLGGAETDVAIARLEALTEKLWTRTGAGEADWRQIIFSVTGAPRVEMQDFVRLFPDLALADAGPHGFPFQARGLPEGVVSLTPRIWQGCIPIAREHNPLDVWLFTDDVQFCCREVRREARDLDRNPLGMVNVGRQILRAVQTTHFIKGVAKRLGLGAELHCTLRMDLEGVSGRTIIDLEGDAEGQLLSEPARWMENRASARLDLRLGDLSADATAVALKLVSELAGQVSVRFADTKKLALVTASPNLRGAFGFTHKGGK